MEDQADEKLELAIEEANEDGDRAMRMFGYALSVAIVICAFVLGVLVGSLWFS